MLSTRNLLAIIRLSHISNCDLAINANRLLLSNNPRLSATTTIGSHHNRRQKHLLVTKENVSQSFTHYKAASAALIAQKWNQAYSFYDQFTHMDEVREAHNKVIMIQQKLEESQERRTALMHELIAIRKEHKQLNDEVLDCNRRDPQYVKLIQKEIDVRVCYFLCFSGGFFSILFLGSATRTRKNGRIPQ